MSDVQATQKTNDKPKRQEGEKNERRHEENKERQPYVHKPRKVFKERTEVTLETVVPDLPKKNEIIAKPDDEAFQKELDKIQETIDECYKKMSGIAKEARNKNYLPADKTFEDLISLLKVKQEERRKAYDEFQATVTERDMYKKQVDDYLDRSNDLRFKMKVPGKKTELEARLKELKNTQSKGDISLAEEKLLIKQISDLERSLPFAGPLEELDEQSKEVREQLKTAKSKSNVKFESLKLLREECKDVQEKIDKLREEHEKRKEETTPAIDKMKDEYRDRINALKQKRKDAYDKHNSTWRKFEEQQAEIERIKFIKRKKDKLLREEARKKRDEEWKKQREAEQEEHKEIPYRAQIELCAQLIRYCHSVTPSTETVNNAENEKEQQARVQEALQSEEWKNSKAQELVSKRDRNDDFTSGKKKKAQHKKVAPKEQATSQPLHHQIETLNYFDEIKVSPPLFTDKLAETIKVVEEKKAYFEKLSSEALAADEHRKTLTEEERKKFDEEEKQKKEEQKTTTNKREDKRQKQAVFNVESEQDFPRM